MRLDLLVEERLRPIPSTISVVNDWGHIHMYNAEKKESVFGHHMRLDGKPEEFKDWLRPHGKVWNGVGGPILQQFENVSVE